MFGFQYIKSSPSHYLMQFRDGRIVREGSGLSFFYFAPRSTLVRVPLSVVDLPFMFEETTRDFQAVTLQGGLGYRIAQPAELAGRLDFSLSAQGDYASDDPERLPSRVLNAVKAQFRALLQGLDLAAVLQEGETLARAAQEALSASSTLRTLGIEVVGLGLLAIKPTPDTARALEAPARERILQRADDATYLRRQAAIEQEQRVRESELRSELVVEQKQREVRETQAESERVLLERRQQLQQQELAGKVALEKQNAELVRQRAENTKCEAEAKAYATDRLVAALGTLDARSLQALTLGDASPETLLALGFQQLAENAAKIGEFNFSPDLLRQLAHARG